MIISKDWEGNIECHKWLYNAIIAGAEEIYEVDEMEYQGGEPNPEWLIMRHISDEEWEVVI